MDTGMPGEYVASEGNGREDTTVEVEFMLPNPTDTVCLPTEILSRFSVEYTKMLAERDASDESLRQIHQRSLDTIRGDAAWVTQ